MDEKFPKKTSTDESKGEMLIDCNHMDQATNMGGDMYVLKSYKRTFKNRSTLSLQTWKKVSQIELPYG